MQSLRARMAPTAETEGGVGHVSQRMAINGHRIDRPRGQGHPTTGEISGANSGSQWFLLVGRLIGISVLLTPQVPLATSRLQTVSGYLYPSQSQVPERPRFNKHAVYRGDGCPCRGQKSCLEIYGTGMYFLNGFGHMHSPAHMLN
jgi:hypothetical protein